MDSLGRRKLYIIGNGFDLAHNLPTRYSDFYNWLNDTHYEMRNNRDCDFFVRILNQIFEHSSNNVDFWSDVEKALGSLAIDKFIKKIVNYNTIKDAEDEFYNDKDYLGEQVENDVNYIYKPDGLDNIRAMFQDWVLHIPNYDDVRPYFTAEDIEKTGLFLTFNYTNTLEKVYGIDFKQILHIHGCVSEKKSNIVVGHETEYDVDKYKELEESLLGGNYGVVSLLVEAMNSLKKNTKQIIQKNQEWFDDLKNQSIDEIHLYGLSFGEIDDEYYKEINRQLPNAKWVFAVYNTKNVSCIQKFVDRIGVSHENCSGFDQESTFNDEISLF